jgi:hypothetical protein
MLRKNKMAKKISVIAGTSDGAAVLVAGSEV